MSLGPNSIHNQVLSHLSPTGNEFLLPTYSYISADNSAPVASREAVVIPILKPGKDCSLRTSYRPIRLTAFIRPWNIWWSIQFSGSGTQKSALKCCVFWCHRSTGKVCSNLFLHVPTPCHSLLWFRGVWHNMVILYPKDPIPVWNLWDQLPLFLLTFLQGCPFHIYLSTAVFAHNTKMESKKGWF
jgi:hypothetical protein